MIGNVNMCVNQDMVIGKLFSVLCQFEKIGDTTSEVTLQSWRNYLDRLYIWFLGYGNQEVCVALKGLQRAGKELKLDTVRRVVFDMISIIKEGG